MGAGSACIPQCECGQTLERQEAAGAQHSAHRPGGVRDGVPCLLGPLLPPGPWPPGRTNSHCVCPQQQRTALTYHSRTCTHALTHTHTHTHRPNTCTPAPRLHPATTHTAPPPAPVTHARVVHACGYRKTRVGQPHHTDVVPQHVLCSGRPSPPTHRVQTHAHRHVSTLLRSAFISLRTWAFT